MVKCNEGVKGDDLGDPRFCVRPRIFSLSYGVFGLFGVILRGVPIPLRRVQVFHVSK